MLWIWQLCFASFFCTIVSICWANAMSSIKNWISASDSYNIDHFFQNFLRFFINFMFSTLNVQANLLPYCSYSSTFFRGACFTVFTWSCDKVTFDFKTSIYLSFSLSIALTSFIISFFKSETKSHLNELSFSSTFLSSSSMVYFFGGMLQSIMKIHHKKKQYISAQYYDIITNGIISMS